MTEWTKEGALYVPRYADASVHARLTKWGRGLVPRNHHKSFRPRTPLGHFFRMLFTEWGMAGSAANYFEAKVMDNYFGNTPYAVLATHYILASTTAIADDGTGATEPVGMAYARAPLANNTTTWTNFAAGAKTNGADFVWSEASGDWTSISDSAVMDALTSGNMLCYGEVNGGTPLAVPSGQTLRIKAGEYDLTFD